MRIVKDSRLREFAKQHSRASVSLKNWRSATRRAIWQSFEDVKNTFRSADQINLPGGHRVVVFNIGGDVFRLITAIHYNRGIVYIRKFLTHAQYSKEDWKNDP
jgi:mRNA interferase HigB